MTGTYRIADKIIEISTYYMRVHMRCADYRTDEAKADLSIVITEEDVAYERACASEEVKNAIRTPGNPLARSLEELAVYRKIAEAMPAYDTFLMHGSCVAVDGEGYLFTAKSGTGKSTHTRLWRELFKDRAIMVNDDKPLIRITEHGAVIYGTPWDGKHHLSTNCSVPLKAVCILERAEQNTIRRIRPAEAYPVLMQQIYRPRDDDAMRKTLELTTRLSDSVGLWRLGCNMDIEAARIAYQAMKGCE